MPPYAAASTGKPYAGPPGPAWGGVRRDPTGGGAGAPVAAALRAARMPVDGATLPEGTGGVGAFCARSEVDQLAAFVARDEVGVRGPTGIGCGDALAAGRGLADC